jgi:phospholipid/cholesterol/gamma-HCH transport system substrate-binding protein
VNPRRPNASRLSSSPVLIGAVTVLVTIVAVFLSYNANEGLPFVPTYTLTAEVPNSAGLVRGNEVRIGGARAGVVSDIGAEVHSDGSVVAVLTLKLDPRIKPLPHDSTILIRPRSALGLKYVEITEGHEKGGYAENATIPESASAARPVEIDDFFNMFDDSTRVGSRGNLAGYGAAFAGRGQSLNQFFGGLEPLVRELEPALRNLTAPDTGFDRLFPALEQAASEVAPIPETQGALYVALDTTFSAWASVAKPVQESISGGPPALDTAIRELPAQRPFLRESEELFRRFRPAFAALANAAPDLSVALKVGTPALRRSPELNTRLTRLIETTRDLGDDSRVPAGLHRLTRTVTLLQPLVEFVKPAQTTCNYISLFFRNGASAISEADSIGTMLRINPMALPQAPGSEAGPSAGPANGPAVPRLPVKQHSIAGDSFLHSNPLPDTAAPGQVRECEAGNEDYPTFHLEDRQAIGNLPGDQGTFTQHTRRIK